MDEELVVAALLMDEHLGIHFGGIDEEETETEDHSEEDPHFDEWYQ